MTFPLDPRAPKPIKLCFMCQADVDSGALTVEETACGKQAQS